MDEDIVGGDPRGRIPSPEDHEFSSDGHDLAKYREATEGEQRWSGPLAGVGIEEDDGEGDGFCGTGGGIGLSHGDHRPS